MKNEVSSNGQYVGQVHKPVTRTEIEDRIELIRIRFRIMSEAPSRDFATDGLLSDIGVLLSEVDYWQVGSERIRSIQTEIAETNLVDDNMVFVCPDCKAESTDADGVSWHRVGHTVDEHGIDIGYMHCSMCGKSSPLYVNKEEAYYNWCAPR